MSNRERIVTGQKYRILSDYGNKIWDRISFWTKASDVEMNDGSNVETKIANQANTIASLSTSVSDVSSAVDGISSTVSSLGTTVGNLSTTVGNLSGSISTINDELSSLEQDNTTNKNNIATNANNISSLRSTVNNHTGSINTINSEIGVLTTGGWKLAIGSPVRRIIGSHPITDQYTLSVGQEGHMYVTKLEALNEYDSNDRITATGEINVDDRITINKGNLFVNWGTYDGQRVGGCIYAEKYIQCIGNIEAHPGSIYARYTNESGTPVGGDIIAENYISATGDHGGSGNIEANHDLIYGNACYQSSDERLKKDVKDLEGSEEFIYSLRPVSYRFKDNDEEVHRGFIAQEVEPLVEEDSAIVGENPRTNYKTLSYTEIIADLVKTVQLQNERIKALEGKLNKKRGE